MWRLLTLLLVCGIELNGSEFTPPKQVLIVKELADFSDESYGQSVEKVLSEFEKRTGIALKPGPLRKCALKISTQSGQGLSTPKPLIRALGHALIKRGFMRHEIILCDVRIETLRDCGFLPDSPNDKQAFEGYPVVAFEPNALLWSKDKRLFYENQVMPRPGTPPVPWGDARISLLPKTLVDEVDFWINLPVLSDGKALGVHGAIAAASLGTLINADRFMDNPYNATKVAVEVCASPLLSEKNVLSILSFESYQILGGPNFDANWCKSEHTLMASANPVIIDFLGWQKMNAGRAERGVEEIRPEPPIFNAANAGNISLGSCKPSEIVLIKIPSEL